MRLNLGLSLITFMLIAKLCFCCGDYRNVALVVTSLLELYSTVNKCIECVVRTHTHVLTGMVYCTSLTYDDVTGLAYLTAENLYTETLAS